MKFSKFNLFKPKKKNDAEKISKPKEKLDWVAAIAGFVSVIVIIGMIGVVCAIGMFAVMLKDKPTLDINDFSTSESSIVYDRNGEVIAELGATIRENITYDDLPNNVIDAFVAVEDSRFFEHNGFDVPRFTKAILENIKSLSFSQGGSTFTMQLVKNTYFTNDATGTNASRSGLSGVERKVQEIALAMELENMISKEDILTMYLNRLNFGGGSQNIRGIQKASYYYFGKPVTEVNLSEAAFLAGVVNAPSAYNPYYHLDLATNRRNTVLYLMYQHGYISEEEYQLNVNIKLEDSLVAENSSKRGSGSATKYQAYIDEVVSEVYDLTGLDPYTTTMEIYTYMDQGVQTVMDNIQKGEVDGYFEFPDDNFELASIATNIKTGEIVGILGGRNYSSGGALLLNHATEQYKQPGSSIKPILDYVLAFEYLGWATDHVLTDKPINYVGTDIVIGNSDGVYRGHVTLYDCIGYSLNTTALQTIQQVVNKVGVQTVVDYLKSVGFSQAKTDTFNVQWGIGGGEFYVSCKQMASAMGNILNYGTYYEPHTIKKIVFANGKTPVEPTYVGTQTLSAGSCYLMSKLLYNNVNSGYANLMYVLKENDYAVYGKTGTTDWGNSGRDYGIPNGAIKDGWCVAGTSDFCVATWVGYEKAIKDEPSYMSLEQYLKCIKEKTTNLCLDATVESFGKPDESMTKPSDVTDITHIIAVYPYVSPIDGMSDQYITTGQILTKYAQLESPESVTVEAINKAGCEVDSAINGALVLSWPKYPDEEKLKVAADTMDISLEDEEEEIDQKATGRRMFDYSWVYGAVKYKANITVKDSGGNVTVDNKQIISSEEKYTTSDIKVNPGDTVTVDFYYGYEHRSINSSKVTVTYAVEDEDVTISAPGTSDLKDETAFKAWAEKYNIPSSSLKIVAATSGHSEGTCEIKYDGEAVNTPTITKKQSELKNFVITYYTKKAASISGLTVSQSIATSTTAQLKITIADAATTPKVVIKITKKDTSEFAGFTVKYKGDSIGIKGSGTVTMENGENILDLTFASTDIGVYDITAQIQDTTATWTGTITVTE